VTIPLDPSGTSTSPPIYPPAGNYVATLEDPQAIGRSKILGSTSFSVPV
jgi:hypothetical protein